MDIKTQNFPCNQLSSLKSINVSLSLFLEFPGRKGSKQPS